MAGAAALAVIFVPIIPTAGSTTLPDSYLSDIRAQLASVGVSAVNQEILIDKLRSGVLWDSLSGAEPVSVATTQDLGQVVVRETYADGSVAISRTQQGSSSAAGVATSVSPGSSLAEGGLFTTLGVSGCQRLADRDGWRRWGNCRSDVNLILVRMQFDFDYSLKPNVQSRIDRAFNHVNFCTCFVDEKKLTITRKYSDGTAPATVRASVRYTVGPWKGVGITSDGWSQASVSRSGTITSSHN